MVEGKKLNNNNNGELRLTLTGMKDYVDAKFQTIINAAKEAKDTADKLSAKTDEANKAFASKESITNIQAKIDMMIERESKFLTMPDYNIRHESLQQKLDEMTKTPWGTYYSFAMVLIVVIGGFWGLAYGPIQTRFDQNDRQRSEIRQQVDDINKLLIQRNDIFVQTKELQAVIKRFEEKNATQDKKTDELLTKAAFESWKHERDQLIKQLVDRIDRLFTIVDGLREPRTIRKE